MVSNKYDNTAELKISSILSNNDEIKKQLERSKLNGIKRGQILRQVKLKQKNQEESINNSSVQKAE